MTEEHNQDPQENVNPEKDRASNDGWVEKEVWVEQGKAADQWVDYNEFNFRGELMRTVQNERSYRKKLEARNAETQAQIDHLNKALQNLGDINKKLAEKQYSEALTTLKKQKKEAIQQADHELAGDIEEQIDNLKENKPNFDDVSLEKAPSKETPPSPQSTIDEDKMNAWAESQDWFDKNRAMTATAYSFAEDFVMQHKGNVDTDELISYIDSEMKKEFPEKYKKAKPGNSPVTGQEPVGGPSGPKKKATKADLSEEEYDVGRTYVKQGIYKDLDEYAAQLATIATADGVVAEYKD